MDNNIKVNSKNVPQIESDYAIFITLQILVEKGYINRPTYENIIRHKLSKYADIA